MNKIRLTTALALVFALLSVQMAALGQRRRPATPQRRSTPAAPSRATQTARTKTTTRAQTTARAKPTPRANPTARTTQTAADMRLTGLYRLDFSRSDDPRLAAERASTFLLPDEQERVIESLTARLTSPDQIAIERRGQRISIGSTRAPRVNFDADGRTRTEQAEDGHAVATRAALYGDQLMISSTGSRDDEFSVNFDSIDNGTRLRVTRRIRDERVAQPVVVQSTYNKVSGVARFNIYGEPEAARTATTDTARNAPRNSPPERRTTTQEQTRAQQPPQQQRRSAPPVIRNRDARTQPPPTPAYEGFVIGNNTQFIATLNNDLSTSNSREGDRFTMTVREPSVFAGATIEGTVSHVARGGRVSGRSEMSLNFERIRLRDGRTADFNAVIESVRPVGGEEVRVDNEGGASVQEHDSQTSRTTERAAIGAAVGAIIGAISGGGKGAAIGAIIGAGAGAGSVYAQGRDDLELGTGTELILRADGSR
ncbi:MAG TPA: YMGG-like glycine zipper-containing protein [Pyrinomonadaceae bacterium]|nr:YMGG-like glycine zipper-containing protein [Pyrinomonadaceae bacterium]